MKILFSRFSHLEMVLEDMAFSLGYMGPLVERICVHLHLRGRPVHPSRRYISLPELRRLVAFMESLTRSHVKLERVLRPKSVSSIVYSCLGV